MASEPTVCDWCGARAPDPADDDPAAGAIPLTWTTSAERGRLLVYCEGCTRQHVRAMEGKLDREHW